MLSPQQASVPFVLTPQAKPSYPALTWVKLPEEGAASPKPSPQQARRPSDLTPHAQYPPVLAVTWVKLPEGGVASP